MRVEEGLRTTSRRVPAVPRPSRSSLPQEHVVVRLRQSGRRLTLPAVLFVALCGATGYWWGRLQPTWLNPALPVAAAVLALLLCLVPLVKWLNRVVLVTNRRIVVSRGFVVRRRSEFLLTPGTEASVRRGPLQLLARSGDVTIRGGDGSIELRDLPNARLVQAAVLELTAALR